MNAQRLSFADCVCHWSAWVGLARLCSATSLFRGDLCIPVWLGRRRLELDAQYKASSSPARSTEPRDAERHAQGANMISGFLGPILRSTHVLASSYQIITSHLHHPPPSPHRRIGKYLGVHTSFLAGQTGIAWSNPAFPKATTRANHVFTPIRVSPDVTSIPTEESTQTVPSYLPVQVVFGSLGPGQNGDRRVGRLDVHSKSESMNPDALPWPCRHTPTAYYRTYKALQGGS
jgi:hypothetical protein